MYAEITVETNPPTARSNSCKKWEKQENRSRSFCADRSNEATGHEVYLEGVIYMAHTWQNKGTQTMSRGVVFSLHSGPLY